LASWAPARSRLVGAYGAVLTAGRDASAVAARDTARRDLTRDGRRDRSGLAGLPQSLRSCRLRSLRPLTLVYCTFSDRGLLLLDTRAPVAGVPRELRRYSLKHERPLATSSSRESPAPPTRGVQVSRPLRDPLSRDEPASTAECGVRIGVRATTARPCPSSPRLSAKRLARRVQASRAEVAAASARAHRSISSRLSATSSVTRLAPSQSAVPVVASRASKWCSSMLSSRFSGGGASATAAARCACRCPFSSAKPSALRSAAASASSS
jgi:hypothetical protein